MNSIKRTVALVRKHGSPMWLSFELLMALFVLIAGFWKEDPQAIPYFLFFLTMMGWDISDAYLLERHEELDGKLEESEKKRQAALAENSRIWNDLRLCRTLLKQGNKGNPVKDNRIVNDKTFALRMKRFIEGTVAHDPASQEEKQYLHGVAERLISWQTRTVRKGSDEYEYLERLGMIKEPPSDNRQHPAPKRKLKTKGNENQD